LDPRQHSVEGTLVARPNDAKKCVDAVNRSSKCLVERCEWIALNLSIDKRSLYMSKILAALIASLFAAGAFAADAASAPAKAEKKVEKKADAKPAAKADKAAPAASK
jgi:hypothetical protein